jgi:hypothetical protein
MEPVSPTRSQQTPCQDSHSPLEAAAGRYSHENHPDEFHNIREEEIDEIEEWFRDFVDECSNVRILWLTKPIRENC